MWFHECDAINIEAALLQTQLCEKMVIQKHSILLRQPRSALLAARPQLSPQQQLQRLRSRQLFRSRVAPVGLGGTRALWLGERRRMRRTLGRRTMVHHPMSTALLRALQRSPPLQLERLR